MMWGYMENVKAYFQNNLYEKYGKTFSSIWIATAYKGIYFLFFYTNRNKVERAFLKQVPWVNSLI